MHPQIFHACPWVNGRARRRTEFHYSSLISCSTFGYNYGLWTPKFTLLGLPLQVIYLLLPRDVILLPLDVKFLQTVFRRITMEIEFLMKKPQNLCRARSTVKMRLRSGRGVFRHNLQPVMDLEDLIHNRTSGKPASIFKKLGDAAKLYVSIGNDDTIRSSNIPLLLAQDHFEKIQNLTLDKVKTLCSSSVFAKSKRFEVITSQHISTQVYPAYKYN